jgi:hypothetical protein
MLASELFKGVWMVQTVKKSYKDGLEALPHSPAKRENMITKITGRRLFHVYTILASFHILMKPGLILSLSAVL